MQAGGSRHFLRQLVSWERLSLTLHHQDRARTRDNLLADPIIYERLVREAARARVSLPSLRIHLRDPAAAEAGEYQSEYASNGGDNEDA